MIFGTRPEAIKLAPVVLALRAIGVPHVVVTTGQHANLVADVLEPFGVTPDLDLGLMRDEQSLDYVLASALESVGGHLERLRPSAVVVQGDTTSMLGSALAAFHRGIPISHVEAGLRSNDMALPFPEEMNRRMASVLATLHFAPTAQAAANLRASGVRDGIHVVGNTVVDAVRHVTERDKEHGLSPELSRFVGEAPYLLATAHRRESWGDGIASIASALREVLDALPDHRLVFVTHPNPVARRPVEEALAGHERARVSGALPYAAFLRLLRGARLVVSDSGGVQEEGPSLGVPVLVTRQVTERPEGVAAGAVRLVGTDRAAIRDGAISLLRSTAELAAMARAGHGLYGDGHAASRIARLVAGA